MARIACFLAVLLASALGCGDDSTPTHRGDVELDAPDPAGDGGQDAKDAKDDVADVVDVVDVADETVEDADDGGGEPLGRLLADGRGIQRDRRGRPRRRG